MNRNRGDWIQTYSGRAYHPFDPDPDEVALIDIAHGLAYSCRFNGQCRSFYSIAEHSVHVADFMFSEFGVPDAALAGLLHDAAEAYIGNVVRPIKRRLQLFKEIERINMIAIYNGLNIPVDAGLWADQTAAADLVILAAERRDLMTTPPMPWESIEMVEPVGTRIYPIGPAEAERQWLDRFDGLMGHFGSKRSSESRLRLFFGPKTV